MAKNIKLYTKKGSISLTDKDYKAAGGQAAVYCKKGYAYKIYHDPNTMIPVAKIKELSQLNRPNILNPLEPLYDVKKKPVGFVMKYIDKNEFLCKVFTKNFRANNNVSHQDIVDLVTDMQKTLEYIHSQGFLVVDYNEMNFLLNINPYSVYHIDVDSWQTPNFPANALMESVRDRKAQKGKFTELTDWFSFAVVTFQMYVGIHPYKGFHPKFSPRDWMKRMDLGISVFDKDVDLPPSCQDFSVIPKKHLDWYKEVFEKGDRSIPPYAGAVAISAVLGKVVTSRDQLVVDMIHDYKSTIKNVYHFDGDRYVLCFDGIYKDKKRIFDFKQSIKEAHIEPCSVFGSDPLLAYRSKDSVKFIDMDRNDIAHTTSSSTMACNGLIYTVENDSLIENSFEKMGKIVHIPNVISSLCPSHKMYRGVVVQDDFMKCHLAIPYEPKMCADVHVKELDGHRIIDAQHEGRVTILIAEKSGKYTRNIVFHDKNFLSYEIKSEDIVSLHAANFSSLPNGLYLMVDDEKVTLFKDISTRKEIHNAPFDVSMRLYHDDMTVLFIDGTKLYSAKMK